MDEPRWLNETEMRAWVGFLETSGLIQRHVEQQLREARGLTMVQYEILHWANDSGTQPLCMTELANRMITSRNGLTYQVSQLEKAGLLQRQTDPDDERRIQVVITGEGRRLLEEAAPGHVRTVREGLFDRLSNEQVAQLADIMETARDHLRGTVQLQAPRKRRGERA
ncbi:MarR family winged helix-turn-helix transcriptional regulator [Nonomuraea turcica]|uniref:MarR family winged helix-turn-helix transcriptional regulator n=1 Tax=Nonomuraea sp. G32 TaxID=3067274 RepID=UPI00273B6FD6|nr:MarR family transcriptional regulator [Nonomuraea sp. G32]MDP4511780.1 MarR family transcriptional regulator [Nonomuraea sp. G32]